jgi:hypothetical protein
MKFSEITDRKAEALKSLYLTILSIKVQEEQELTRSGMKYLLFGNTGGIALLTTFFARLSEHNLSASAFKSSLVLYVLGAFLAAFIYLPLIGVASNASSHYGDIIEKFFRDELNLENMQGYGFTPRGRIIVLSLLGSSITSFAIATIIALFSLFKI